MKKVPPTPAPDLAFTLTDSQVALIVHMRRKQRQYYKTWPRSRQLFLECVSVERAVDRMLDRITEGGRDNLFTLAWEVPEREE